MASPVKGGIGNPPLGLLAVLVLGVVFVLTDPASGWVSSGCKFAASQHPTITYEFNAVTTTNQSALNTAQSWWDGDTSPTTYFVLSWGDVNVEVYDKWDYSTTKSAWWSYGCTGGVFSSHEGSLVFNDVHMPGSSHAKAVVAVHELGHAYGLDHQSMSCSGTPRVMEQGSEKWSQVANCATNPPWTDDVIGWQTVN